MLSIRDLTVYRDTVRILNGVSLEVGPGEIVALLGANGVGKTTTLMAVSGILPVATGAIFFEHHTVHALKSHDIVRCGIVQVPEGRHVFPRLTVEENLRLGAFRRQDPRGWKLQMQRMWELFPILKDRSRQLAGTLSGGEQQMLALARGLMAEPKLLLLDEPSLGLAPKIVSQVFSIIQRINREGLSILLVEQNAYQALQIAHRGYVLSGGKIVLSGKTSELVENPAVKAAYLGGSS